MNSQYHITPQFLTAIDEITKQLPDAIFGGSLALNMVGLINRPIDDLDIFIDKDKFVDTIELVRQSEDSASAQVLDDNGKIIERRAIEIAGVKVCLFLVDSSYMQHAVMTIGERDLKIQNVNFAIKAKIQYGSRALRKHQEDLRCIAAIGVTVPETVNDLDLPF